MKRLSLCLGVLFAGLFVTNLASAAVPAAPEYLKVAWIENQSEFLIRWLPVADASSYHVYRYDTNALAWVQIATNLVTALRVPMFRDATVAQPGPVTYAVSAVNAEGEGLAAVGSLTPQPGAGMTSTGDAYPPAGFTWAILSFSTDREPGSDTMVELTGAYDANGPVHTNVFDVMWNTNISQWHQLQFTNLSPSMRYDYRYTRVEENGYGLSYSVSWHYFYTQERPFGSGYEENPIAIYGWITPVYEVQIYTQPANGTAVVEPSGYWMFLYTGNTNFAGVDSFQILDHPSGPPVTISVYVTNINDGPVAAPFTVYMAEDTSLEITPQVTDPENNPYHVYCYPTPPNWECLVANGTFMPLFGPSFTYIPNTDFVGTEDFFFFAMDQDWGPPARGIIIVTNVNDRPVVANQRFDESVEDTPVSFTLAASDVDGDVLTVQIVDPPMHGLVSVTGLDVVYTPSTNYHGPDYFTYRVGDAETNSELGNVDFTIAPVNDAPTSAEPLTVSTPEDTGIFLAFAGTDPDGDNLTYEVVQGPEYGEMFGNYYVPAANYVGSDTLTYRMFDGIAYSPSATVTITITAVNDAPVADNKAVAVNEDQSVAIALTGSDVEGASLTFTVLTAPQHGQFVGGVYTPAANYFGPDSFTYKANDGQLDSEPATVSITINPVNDAPVATGQSVSTPYNTAVNIVLTGSDVEGSALTYSPVTSPANGMLTGTGANRTFTPNIGWYGNTSFTFKVNDGALDSATATVTITVAGPGAVPAAPSALTATAVSQTQIDLAWNDNSGNEDGFKIERATGASGPWTEIATVGPNVLNYASTGLTKNKRYYYRVRAYNILGNSAYSNTANARTLN